MNELKIETAENGFVVYESSPSQIIGKQWAFESSSSLAIFIKEWGDGNTKVSDGTVGGPG